MSNTALFKEAIAEAKAVRDAAMANAKAALEETITPHLQNMLAAKLEEMASEEETVAEEVAEAVEEEVMEEEMPKSVTEEDESEEETPEEESEEEEAPEEEEETPEEESEEETPEDEMEIGEMTMEELEELINDIVAQQMENIEDSSDEIDMTGAEEEGEGELAQADIDAEELESETISMEELLAEIEEITEAAKNEEVEEGTHNEEVEEGKYMEKEAINEIDLEVANAPQIIAAVIATLGAFGVGSMINTKELKKMALPKLKAFAAKLGIGKKNEEVQEGTNTEELNEALETIETLKKDISETNLLNAKLLYVNKIFKANNLTENQKVNTITAFDKAETVKEVKLVFETISEGLDKTASSCVNENKGFASKAAGVAPKTITEAVKTPDNSWRDRMQVLAGIKKPN